MTMQPEPPSAPDPIAAFRVEATVPGNGKDPLLLAYGELLLRQGPSRLFRGLSAEDIYRFVSARYAFVRQRQPAPFGLRLTEYTAGRGEGATNWCLFDVVLDDRPFLIDSIRAYFTAYSIRVQAVFHPVLAVQRDAKGVMTGVSEFKAGAHNEAHMTFITDPLPETQHQPVLEALRLILQDVIFCVDDFPAITRNIDALKAQAAKGSESRFVAQLLQWCEQSHFVFMGYLPFKGREEDHELLPRQEEGLGLFNPHVDRDTHHEALLSQVGRLLNTHARDKAFFIVEETNIPARVHRRTRLSAILCSPTRRGKKREAAALIGVFTHRSLREDVLEIPAVADKIAAVLEAHELVRGSHTYKAVLDYINGIPRFELFRLSTETLGDMVDFLLSIIDQPRTEIALRPEPAENALRILVTTPVSEFPQDKLRHIRERVETLLSRTAQNVYVVEVSQFSVVNFVFHSYEDWRERMPAPGVIEEVIAEELQTRDDRLVRMWVNERGMPDDRMARALVAALPEDYKVGYAEWEILADLNHVDQLLQEHKPQFDLRELNGSSEVKAVLYAIEKVSLSKIMPIFSNLRLHVVEEKTFQVALHERPVYLHTFLLQPPANYKLHQEPHERLMRELIFNILAQSLGEEPLNALLITCGFRWRQVNLLCLYRNYLMQVGTVYTRSTINETLINRARVAQALFGAFDARFNPDLENAQALRAKADEELDDAEREIDNLTEDRIVQAMRNLLRATVRTNFYQDGENPVVAVKLDSRLIEGLPAPRPMFEIYVYAPLMEGIHLRGDMIARGGLRYSDRPDDFRTEVLGLMATQMKKNALIVPLGSKGGFVVKNLGPYAGDVRAAGDAQYKVYVRALLSITDNLVHGQVVPPPRVVRHDVDDPYLVVAADKGTAHLSDTANAIAQDMGFWLDDAFASGGSHGYDHKQVGITARGAWESVKRHFWERGIDVQSEPVSVVGIGDMSGDVFGNGMLCSRTLKLVGAFDHRHIFVDPDPDLEAAYEERARLFALPRSSWMDYDKSKLSAGGGVFPRNAKEIAISPQMQRVLGTTKSGMSGEELIRTLLSAEVDLLWNGGIGTYIKSRAETHVEVADPNNNAVRIDAESLRARVVGEGGNLGLTQQARIEIDLKGASIISDAVDNAGGVNLSDHEVNLKILLHTLTEHGQLPDRETRNALLAELTEPVTQAVLRANFRQVLVISMDRRRSQENVNPFVRLVDTLAAGGSLDRRTEALPNAQRFQQFQSEGKGIPRPVLSVLLAYTKMLLYRRLVDSKVVDDEFCRPCFAAYFPLELAQRYAIADLEHPLRRNIIATVMTNRLIDQAGITFINETAALTDKSWPELTRAYMEADAIVNGLGLREEIYSLATTMPAEQQYELLQRLEDLLASMTRWLLLRGDDASEEASPAHLAEALSDYCRTLPTLLNAEDNEQVAGESEQLQTLGMTPAYARLAAQIPHLAGFLFVHTTAEHFGMSLADTYALVTLMNEKFMFSRLTAALEHARFTDTWEKQFGDKQRNLLAIIERTKLNAILAHRTQETQPPAWMDAYLATRQAQWKAYQDTVRKLFNMDTISLVAIAVAVRQLELV